METSNSAESIVNAPGTPLSSKVTVSAIGTIRTDTQETKDLVVSPVSVATINTALDTIQLMVVVFVPKTTPSSFIITQSYSTNASGYPELQFYICTDYLVHSGTNNFDGYQLNFTADATSLPEGVLLKDIVTIESFLWNKDPKTSRGTVTTVIHAA